MDKGWLSHLEGVEYAIPLRAMGVASGVDQGAGRAVIDAEAVGSRCGCREFCSWGPLPSPVH